MIRPPKIASRVPEITFASSDSLKTSEPISSSRMRSTMGSSVNIDIAQIG